MLFSDRLTLAKHFENFLCLDEFLIDLDFFWFADRDRFGTELVCGSETGFFDCFQDELLADCSRCSENALAFPFRHVFDIVSINLDRAAIPCQETSKEVANVNPNDERSGSDVILVWLISLQRCFIGG